MSLVTRMHACDNTLVTHMNDRWRMRTQCYINPHVWTSLATHTCGMTHSYTCDMTHSYTCDMTHSYTCDMTHSYTCDVTHSYTCDTTHSYTCDTTHSYTCDYIYVARLVHTCDTTQLYVHVFNITHTMHVRWQSRVTHINIRWSFVSDTCDIYAQMRIYIYLYIYSHLINVSDDRVV